MLEEQNGDQGDQTQEQVPQRAVVGIGTAAAEEAEDHLEDAAAHLRAHDSAVGVDTGFHTGGNGADGNACHHGSGDGLVNADKAGGSTHDDGQTGADGDQLSDLDHGVDTCHQHRILQQGNTQGAETGFGGDAADGHDDQQKGTILRYVGHAF